MDVRFLKSLVAVVENGSIAAAARRENRTAAAISQRIQALERTLGCTLLLRTAHATRPSDQCLLMLPKIRAIIEQAQALQDDLHLDGLVGEVKIGAISTALTGVLPALIERLAISAPDLKLKITPGDSRSLYEKVLNAELDAAILVRPPFQPPKALALAVLKVEPLILVAPAARVGQSLETLLREGPFIRYDARSWGGQIAQRYLDEQAIEPNVLCELDALETIIMLVAQGMGVSLVPQWVGMALDGLYVLPVEDGQRYSRELVVMHGSTPHRPLAMRHLLELLCGSP
ncbi:MULTISPECIES: LysR family transcriptional regulator [unclassified Pseudomonas]|jgi:DNA-binding transcriptional LysR family regulator|uniref:LysR family transcriptional regulator n=1 Tax=unclassified Pseudomonas TaxID=196821 RepID=UPI002A363F00|nr:MULTISPECIES: LysR family transcriptional regulator [unclassified Pseudomonas]MDX9671517.1 LysR family transcriptional regulator [Pseudomonas sp. P8_250]WPN34506.1 LysR family transcriptional regulator [Pseudomonas sp. P8_139]WPN43695.1 LysR family transcriptional regulator [Pseudomonas sp. P8_229]